MHTYERHSIVLFLAAFSFLTLGSSLLSFNFAESQQPICTNGTIQQDPSSEILPVILIHGYKEGASVWHTWEGLLSADNIPFCTVSFSQISQDFDQCGSAADHAKKLGSIVKEVEDKTGKKQVNIVTHSKGGLDARVYLDKSHSTDVAALIMIGTPNAGDPVEDQLNLFDPCTPAADDLKTGVIATMAKRNIHTHYYTIVGRWSPPASFSIPIYAWYNPNLIWLLPDSFFSVASVPSNCPQQDWLGFEIRGYSFLTVLGVRNNDGIVPQESAESLSYSTKLQSTDDCHTNLLSEKSFSIAEPYLLGQGN